MHDITLAGFGTLLTAIVLPLWGFVLYQLSKWRKQIKTEREQHERTEAEARKANEDRLLSIVNTGNSKYVEAMERMLEAARRSFNEQTSQMRQGHVAEVADLRGRVDKQADRLDNQQQFIRDLATDFQHRHDALQTECRRLSDALLKETRQKGELEKKVALLEREVELLRGR